MNRLTPILIASSLLVMSPVGAWLPQPTTKPNTVHIISQVLPLDKLRQFAQAITVKIVNKDAQGSGVIIAKDGNTYTVLTNAHVIRNKNSLDIQTADKKIHQAKIISLGNSLEGNDLAVLQFQATQTYQTVPLAINPNLQENQPVYAVGFPDETGILTLNEGKISLFTPKPFIGGYQIGYSNEIKPGMSGGPLLNQQGELIGINGLLSNPILNDAYRYQDGSYPTQDQIKRYRNTSFAVPIQTLISLAPDLAVIPSQWKAGANIAEKVDRIAQKVTVRIDSQNSGNGSGAIIAKEGQTYYVVTAAHVVRNPDRYEIVTPDGEKYPLKTENIFTPKGIDAALVQFTSSKNYPLASIGSYNISFDKKQWVFLSGFPGEAKGVRKFTTGFRFSRDRGLVVAKDNFVLTINGYELVYTNLTRPGMSGGPVFDTQGNLIGINAGVEGEYASGEIQLGYALGVPEPTLLSLANQKGIKPKLLNIVTTAPPDLNSLEVTSLKTHSSFAVTPPPNDGTANDWLNYGNQLWRLERFEDAAKALKQAIKLKPDFYQAYYALGLVRLSQGNFAEAVQAFDQVITLNPDYYEGWRDKGYTLQNMGKYADALVAIDQALKIRDDDFSLYNYKGGILWNLQRYKEAKQVLDRAIELNPGFYSYLLRGVASTYLDDNKSALADFNKAIELQPDYADTYKMRGSTRFLFADYQGAISDFTKAIELQPKIAENYAQRGRFYAISGDYPTGIKDFTKAIELQSDNGDYYAGRGDFYNAIGDYQKALQDYNQAIKFSPTPLFYSTRAGIYSNLSDYQAAIKDYTQAITLQPKFGSAYMSLANTRAMLQDYQGALADYNKAIELQSDKDVNTVWFGRNSTDYVIPSDIANQVNSAYGISVQYFFASAYTGRASIYIHLQDYQKALDDYNQAIKIDPNTGSHYESRGNFYMLIKEEQKAKTDYQKAIEIYSAEIKNHPDALTYNSRGSLRANLQDYQGAMQDFSKAIELQPNIGFFFYSRADVRVKQQDYQGAIADFSKAIELQPSNSFYYTSRANAYIQAKNYQAAIRDYSKAIELQPNNVAIYGARATIFNQLQDYQGALKDVNKIIELQPDNIAAYGARYELLFKLKDYKGAMNDANKVIELQPNLPNGYLGRGIIYQAQGNYASALTEYNLALSKDANSLIAINNIGIIKYEQGDKQGAIAQWIQVVKSNDKAVEAIMALAVAFYVNGEQEKALQLAEIGLKIDKSFGHKETLKANLWGEKLLKDAEKLLSDPKFAQLKEPLK